MDEQRDYYPQEEPGLQITPQVPEETPEIAPPPNPKIEGEVIDWLKKIEDEAKKEWGEKYSEAHKISKLAPEITGHISSTGLQGLKKLSEELIAQYPEHQEFIISIIETHRFLANEAKISHYQKKIANERLPKKTEEVMRQELKKSYLESAESMFLFTHLLAANAKNPETAKNFWRSMNELIEKNPPKQKTPEEIEEFARGIQRGVTGQVAVHLLLKEMGIGANLSHPSKDAFFSTDSTIQRVDKEIQIQIKSKRNLDRPVIISAQAGEKISAGPKSAFDRKIGKGRIFAMSNHMREQFANFVEKIEANNAGLFIAIPASYYDQETGIIYPNKLPELKNLMQQEIDRIK